MSVASLHVPDTRRFSNGNVSEEEIKKEKKDCQFPMTLLTVQGQPSAVEIATANTKHWTMWIGLHITHEE